MSDFPAVRHAVTVGVRVVDERPVLGLFERVRKSIAVGVQGLSRFSAFTEDVLFGSTFEVADAFVGLPESLIPTNNEPKMSVVMMATYAIWL